MTRLLAAFRSDRPALVAFVTAGDPSPAATPAILDALVEGGADVVELGMPFTDPMADGPAIQAANLRSLAAGTTTAQILDLARGFRERHPDVPLVPYDTRDALAAALVRGEVDGALTNVSFVVPRLQDGTLGRIKIAGIFPELNTELYFAVRRDQPRLAALHTESPDRALHLRADRGIEYGEVLRVMGLVQRAGISKVALVSLPGSEDAPTPAPAPASPPAPARGP